MMTDCQTVDNIFVFEAGHRALTLSFLRYAKHFLFPTLLSYSMKPHPQIGTALVKSFPKITSEVAGTLLATDCF